MKHNYNEYNSNSDNTILLLHGWGGNKQSLDPLAKELSQHLTNKIINLELPGFGETLLTQEVMSSKDFADFVYEFIKTKKLGQTILVGHSFGGKVALNLVLKYPQIANQLVLINTSGLKPKNNLKKVIFKILTAFAPAKVKESGFLRKLFYKKIVRENDYLNADKMRATFSKIVQEHLDEEIAKLDLPTLIIWSEKDSYVPLWMGKLLNKKIKSSILKIATGETHGLPLKNPKMTSELIIEFLNNG